MTAKELINRPVGMRAADTDINSIFVTIAGTSGKNVKNDFLKSHMNQTIQDILTDTYGDRKYFVKKYDVYGSGELTIDADYQLFRTMLDKLATRQLTGQAAVDEVVTTIEQFRRTDQVWLARILDGNLRIGVGSTFSEDEAIIEKYPCALANVLEKAKNVNVLDGSWFASRKLDGVRCHAHVDCDTGTVKFISRQGKEFTTLDKVRPEILSFMRGLAGKWVIDGEMCIVGDDGKEDFRGLMSLVRRKNFSIEHPRYKVFDILTDDEFWGRVMSDSFSVRHLILQEQYIHYTGNIIDVIEQEFIQSQADLDKWLARREAGQWEGVMVRRDVAYEGKRTNNLLKIKPFQDAEYEVIDTIEGNLTYNTDHGVEIVHGVSAIVIEHNGNRVQVGSGLTRAQRVEWLDASKIIGKTITVQYFEETIDSKTGLPSLRFPTLKCVYDTPRDL